MEVDRSGILGILIHQRWSRQDLLSDGRWGVIDGFKVFALCMDKGHTGAEMVRLQQKQCEEIWIALPFPCPWSPQIWEPSGRLWLFVLNGSRRGLERQSWSLSSRCETDILYLTGASSRACYWSPFGTSWRKEATGGGGLGLGTPVLGLPSPLEWQHPDQASQRHLHQVRADMDLGAGVPRGPSRPRCLPHSEATSLCLDIYYILIVSS